MYAKEFNAQVDSVLAPILAEAGFRKVQSCFVREVGSDQLVLFRFAGSKFASLCQFTRFMLCFRHTFLRDVWEKIPQPLPREASGFPFRIRPSDLVSGSWRKWKYRFQLNPSEYDEIEFGKETDAKPILREMGEAVSKRGLAWAEQFAEQEALRLLTASTAGAYIEQLWIEDYRARLQQGA